MSKSAITPWDRHVALLIGNGSVVNGAAIIPIEPAVGAARKSAIHAQKGLSFKTPEVTTLIEAVMDGKVHKDYVVVGGLQYLITTVMQASYYGKAMSTAAPGGIVIVKTAKLLVVAVYSDPVQAAQAIPYVHQFTDKLPTLLGPT
mmetsp:Transcript_45078/g.125009  ORF Transcript_45078/g.125009 Transcript_45078/m.125009 type:complete len:145 (-) Transcript_45078:315-749(-)